VTACDALLHESIDLNAKLLKKLPKDQLVVFSGNPLLSVLLTVVENL
jgi:hypothetical protein